VGGEVGTDFRCTFIQRVDFGEGFEVEFFGDSGVDLGSSGEVRMRLASFFLGQFIDLEGVNAATVLVDDLHNVFQELLQTLTLEFETDEVAGVVALSLQQLLCVSPKLPMLLFCIILLLKSYKYNKVHNHSGRCTTVLTGCV
jgi:hypothetical protein